MIDIRITNEVLNVQICLDKVVMDSSGGNALFVGSVRNSTKSKSVLRLEFEAYEPMAIKEMQKIAERMFEEWPLHGVSIHHRVGSLQIGEIPVIIAVSAAHRAEAFEACQFAIDELKKTVPIWKREFFEDGDVWVAAHP